MKFHSGDRFFLKTDSSREGTIKVRARDDEFGCDLYFEYEYYVVEMDNGAPAPIQTNEGGIAEESDMVLIAPPTE